MCSCLPEKIYYVTEHALVYFRTFGAITAFVRAPMVPGQIHFMREPNDERTIPDGGLSGERGQVSIVVPF